MGRFSASRKERNVRCPSQLHFSENTNYAGEKLTFDNSWRTVTCAFGTQFLKIGAIPDLPSDKEILRLIPKNKIDEVALSGKKYQWEEYAFSWQQGVEGDFGHQGYHGLKGAMYDNFIRLGAIKDVKMSKQRVPEPARNYYLLYTTIIYLRRLRESYCMDRWRSNTGRTRSKTTNRINQL